MFKYVRILGVFFIMVFAAAIVIGTQPATADTAAEIDGDVNSDLRNLQRAFRSATQKAGLKGFRFHDLSHTSATRFIRDGKVIKITFRILLFPV